MENIHNDVKVQRVKDFNHMLYTLTSVAYSPYVSLYISSGTGGFI